MTEKTETKIDVDLQEALDLLDEMAALLDRFSAPQSSKPRERNWRPLSVREARRKLRVLKKRVSGDE